MPTFTALTTSSGKSQAEALGEALERLSPEPTGVGVFEEQDDSGIWQVAAYFTESPDAAGLAVLAAAFGVEAFAVEELPETDWIAKVNRDLSPVVAGRFFVYGSHDADKVPEEAEPLLIEAAMAFGTGHHGTTLGCLKALDRLATAGFVGQNVADVGCGTAVLAMGAARIWPNTVLASDIDEVAVDVARSNAAANGLADQIVCLEAAGFGHPELAAKAPFDLVFANILKSPLVDLAPSMGANISAGGYAILSGLLNEQADEVIAAYDAVGFGVHTHEEIGEWATLTMEKRPN